MPPKDITTEDGVIVHCGDEVYDYYTMEPVTITSEPGDDGWFRVSGNAKLLNGQRICTLEFARRKGFANADEPR